MQALEKKKRGNLTSRYAKKKKKGRTWFFIRLVLYRTWMDVHYVVKGSRKRREKKKRVYHS